MFTTLNDSLQHKRSNGNYACLWYLLKMLATTTQGRAWHAAQTNKRTSKRFRFVMNIFTKTTYRSHISEPRLSGHSSCRFLPSLIINPHKPVVGGHIKLLALSSRQQCPAQQAWRQQHLTGPSQEENTHAKRTVQAGNSVLVRVSLVSLTGLSVFLDCLLFS